MKALAVGVSSWLVDRFIRLFPHPITLWEESQWSY
jgi:hypothetical protein